MAVALDRGRDAEGYLPVEDYGIIGDMRTCALVGRDGSIDYMCWPRFDSPSMFGRLLDSKIGGHWSVAPYSTGGDRTPVVSKQYYSASSNVLQTRWIHEAGVVTLTDFFAVNEQGDQIGSVKASARLSNGVGNCDEGSKYAMTSLTPTLVRRLDCARGGLRIVIECCPRPDYARGAKGAHHYPFKSSKVIQVPGTSASQDIIGEPGNPSFRVTYTSDRGGLPDSPTLFQKISQGPDGGSNGFRAEICLSEGEEMYLVMADGRISDVLSSTKLPQVVTHAEADTTAFWTKWVRQCRYRGRFQQEVERSMLILKLLTYKPTGAIIAAPTFSLPEAIGGTRNWDYRYSWVCLEMPS